MSRRKTNPGGQHVAGLPPRYQAIYEQIKKQYLADGLSLETAESYAAATAWKIFKESHQEISKNVFHRGGGKSTRNVASKKGKGTKPRRSKGATKTKPSGVRHASKSHAPASRVTKFVESFIPAPVTALVGNSARATARKIGKGFHGRKVKWSNATVSRHVAGGAVAGLGRLDHLKVKRPSGKVETIRFGRNAKLVATGSRGLAIANHKFGRRGKNPAGLTNVGDVTETQYETDKPHLGFKGQTTFFHKHGEESGMCPHLFIDEEGFGIIKGGALKVTPMGIAD
jgi:hypothetical protein